MSYDEGGQRPCKFPTKNTDNFGPWLGQMYCCEVAETRQNRFPNDAPVELTSYVCDSHCEVLPMHLHMMCAISACHDTFIDVMIF